MKYISTMLSAGLASILAACGTTIIVYETATDGGSGDASPGSFPASYPVPPGAASSEGTSGDTGSSGFVPTAGMDHVPTTSAATTASNTDTATTDPDTGALASSSEVSSGESSGIKPDMFPSYDCGNWLIEPGEVCDDGPPTRWLDGCDNCERTALFAFVTSPVYEGGSLTLEWADAECSALGAYLGFPAMIWRAWVSDGANDSALDRIGSTTLPYLLLAQGEHPLPLVADSPQFGSGLLLSPFNRDESGVKVGVGDPTCDELSTLVWTWTNAQGTTSDSCENNVQGMAGSVNDMGPGWTELCTLNCAQSAHLYCVEFGG